jgi:hypothetical protein
MRRRVVRSRRGVDIEGAATGLDRRLADRIQQQASDALAARRRIDRDPVEIPGTVRERDRSETAIAEQIVARSGEAELVPLAVPRCSRSSTSSRPIAISAAENTPARPSNASTAAGSSFEHAARNRQDSRHVDKAGAAGTFINAAGSRNLRRRWA